MTAYYGLKQEYKKDGVTPLEKTTRYRIMVFLATLVTPEWIPLNWQVRWVLFLLRVFGFVSVVNK